METTKTIRYHRPDLEAVIDQKIALIEQHIPIVAVGYAEKREPPLSNEDLSPYIGEFHVQYQEILYLNNDSIQTNNLEANRIKDNERTRDDIAELQNQLTASKEDQLKKERERPILKQPFPMLRLYLAWVAVGMLSLFEGLMNRPSFSAWGYNLLEACCMAVALAVLLAIFAHSFERIVNKGVTLWQRRMIAIALLLFIGMVFWYLADVRAKLLSSQAADSTGDTSLSFSPIPMVLLSMLLFLASVLICHFFLPTREQRAALRDYRRQIVEIEEEHNKIAQLEAAIKSKEAANDELNRVHNSLQEYGAILEQRIMTKAEHGLELWKKHNFLHRSDGRPKSFDNTEYPFKFKTFFHHVNLM